MMNSLRGATSLPISSSNTRAGALGVADADAAQRAVPAVHRRRRELVGVHLAESLVALDRVLVPLAASSSAASTPLQLGLGVGVDRLVRLRARVHHDDAVQRRHGGEHPALLDHRPHVAEEQREQQRADVRAVDVGVGS